MSKHLLNRTFIYEASVKISRILPRWLLRGIGRFGAAVSYLLLPGARKAVKGNLSRVYDDRKKINRTARRIFFNYGSYVADWAKLNHTETSNLDSWFSEIKGREVIEKGLAKGKGILLLTAHLGNWELGSLFFSHADIPINVITAQDDIAGVGNVREASRALHNVKTITMREDNFFFIDIVNSLRSNEIVAMLLDRYKGSSGVEVDFFGEKTLFPTGPVQLARSTGAAVMPAFMVYDDKGKYLAVADSIVEMEFTDNTEQDIRVNTQKIVRVLENYIRNFSDQWYNFSALWPDDEFSKEGN